MWLAVGRQARAIGPASAGKRTGDQLGDEDSAPTVQARHVGPEGIQRYGEAVVRQVLGATFLHEEPYEPATRFQ